MCLGEVTTVDHNNEKGNRELPSVLSLHESLLHDNGGSWDVPPPRVAWGKGHRLVRDRIIEEFESECRWGFKDPRSLLLLDGWLEAIPGLVLIGVFRHPAAVAASLRERNGLPLSTALILWEIYNKHLLEAHDKSPFPILSFDLPEEGFIRALRDALVRIGLSPPPRFGFFEDRLRHERAEAIELPHGVRSLYKRLKERALR